MTSPQPKAWHGREPDVRCDWFHACERQAVVVLHWNDGRLARGGRRVYCDVHSYTADDPALSPDHIAPLIRDPRPISLLCGALAGSWSPEMERLLAQSLDRDASAEDRAGAEMALLDLAEERGLDSGGWERVERRWIEATGRHEHVWLPWRSGEPARAATASFASGRLQPRRCTCGIFEHEHAARAAIGPSLAWLAECRICSRPRVMTRPGHTAADVARVTRELRLRCECAFESVREFGSWGLGVDEYGTHEGI